MAVEAEAAEEPRRPELSRGPAEEVVEVERGPRRSISPLTFLPQSRLSWDRLVEREREPPLARVAGMEASGVRPPLRSRTRTRTGQSATLPSVAGGGMEDTTPLGPGPEAAAADDHPPARPEATLRPQPEDYRASPRLPVEARARQAIP